MQRNWNCRSQLLSIPPTDLIDTHNYVFQVSLSEKPPVILVLMSNASLPQWPVTVDEAAKKIWDYMLLHQRLGKADIILALGCSDEYVAERAAYLCLDGYGRFLLISGGAGPKNNLLATAWEEETEAEHFAKIILSRGIPEGKILIEKRSTNTGENIAYSHELLKSKDITARSLIVVCKQHMERRVFATFKKQWPNPKARIQVTSHPLTYDDYVKNHVIIPEKRMIDSIVGGLQRIREYPKLDYQIEQEIPDDVWQAYEFLVTEGYDSKLI